MVPARPPGTAGPDLTGITARRGRYAPGRLVTPEYEPVAWEPDWGDEAGSGVAHILCPGAVEVRFQRPAGSDRFQIAVRSRLEAAEGTEWIVLVPASRFGLLKLPAGFSVEQSVHGAVYRLDGPRTLRLLAVQPLGLPALNLEVQFGE